MSKFVYRVMFDNGNTVTFESTVNVDFHTIGVSEHGAGSMAFDDIFINLQHVVFIDKEEKVENTSMEKCCATCKYETTPIPAEPCFSCIHGLCSEHPYRTEKWEAKDGTNNT